ncbi:MAG: hypothetical protein ABI306_01870 [Caulobacteraceae bacterium]
MKDEYDFSKGERGKFYHPAATLTPPVHLDPEGNASMLTFTTFLEVADISLPRVRLLRHQDNRYPGYPTPYVLWRDHRPRF